MRPTREGKRFLLSTFLIGVAALNTGNNLIYLILAMMLAILAISYALLAVNLRGLELAVSVHHPVFAGQTSLMDISIKNGKRFLASYSLRVRLPEALKGEGYVSHVPASSKSMERVEVRFLRRGVYSLGDFTIESSFPFIFFTRRRKVSVDGGVTVYPEIRDMDIERMSGGHGEDSRSLRPGRGEELLMIRDFRHGDEMKMVHWKATAKTGRLMVRQSVEDEPRMISIVLDDTGDPSPRAFEQGVRYAASAASKLLEEGFYVSLVSCSKRIPFGSGMEQLYRILDTLAVIGEKEDQECQLEGEVAGGCLLILKNEASALKDLVPLCDTVVYASRV